MTVVISPAAAQFPVTAETLTDKDVREAIDAIVGELYARKHPTHFWEPARLPTGQSKQTGGYTALAVLALLYAGETYQHPDLRDAVAYLQRVSVDGTYAVAVRLNIWAMLPPKFGDLLATDTKWLTDGFSAAAGGWTYRQAPNSTRRDNSITQYGALGLWEAAKRGQKIDRSYWQRLEERFLKMQLADGGWNYTGDGPATGSMTAAGLATLFITQDLLHAREFLDTGGTPAGHSQEAIERGLQWMRRNFSHTQNPGRDEYFFYYLYAVERVGLASGYKYFGTHDWFRQAAAEVIGRLLRRNPVSGTLTVRGSNGPPARGRSVKLHHLAFGLLLLSRGRVPVAFNKLEAPGLAWNNRPRDVANLTRRLSSDTETALNWQIVSIDAEPHEWLDAPVLYLASHQAVPWTAQSAPLAKLTRYLDLGGLMFAVNEGRSHAFAHSIEAMGQTMYPQLTWRTLPADHWVYTILWPIETRRPPLRGLSNGVRELIILSPDTDFSAAFQVGVPGHADKPEVYRTAAHIYLYASEMNRPRPRLARHSQTPLPDETRDQHAAATVVRARHGGNWNPEPAALDVFAAALAADPAHPIRIRIVDDPLAAIDRREPPPALVIASGINAHEFTAEERRAIQAYVKAGGVILFETPGGRGDFTRSAESACGNIFQGEAGPIQPLLRSPIITAEGLEGAVRLGRVGYRPYSLEVFGARETRPRLRGMIIDGQPRVLFSRDDLTHALLDQPCWGVSGYSPATAKNLLANILRHALRVSPS